MEGTLWRRRLYRKPTSTACRQRVSSVVVAAGTGLQSSAGGQAVFGSLAADSGIRSYSYCCVLPPVSSKGQLFFPLTGFFLGTGAKGQLCAQYGALVGLGWFPPLRRELMPVVSALRRWWTARV